MPLVYNSPFVCIFLCMVCAIVLSVVRDDRHAFRLTVAVTVLCAALSLVFLLRICADNCAFTFTMGKFAAPLGNEIKAGPLQALFALCFSSVSALSLLGGGKELFHDVKSGKMGIACVFFSMILASLLVFDYTNDLFTAYVVLEISTMCSCSLVMIKENGATFRATMRYLIISLMGSGMFLFGLAMLYGITGHLLMPQATQAFAGLMESGNYARPLVCAVSMMCVGLGVKSAMFPFHRWLPDAHGSASTASSAVLSGLVVKGFALLNVILFCRVFTLESVRTLGINRIIFILGLLGMIMGSVYAMKESHVKRMLAYSSVAQLGYVFMGIGLATPAGMAAACFQMLSHAAAKPLLFVCAGKLSDCAGHKKQLSELQGGAWNAPLAGIGFTLGALSMVGIPLLAGFTSKLNFALSAVGDGESVLPTLAVLALSSLLNALYYIPAVIGIWNGNGSRQNSPAGKDAGFVLAALGLGAMVLALGIFFAPVMDIIERGLTLL